MKKIEAFLEYLLVYFAIIECNSLFMYSLNNGSSQMEIVSTGGAILLEMALLFILLFRNRRSVSRELLLIILPIMLYLTAFYYLNVRLAQNSYQSRFYFLRFLVYLPLFLCILHFHQNEGRPFALLYKHADLTFYFSCANLLIYLLLVFDPDRVYGIQTLTRWTDLGKVKDLLNYYNICHISLTGVRTIGGVTIFRNLGCFTEPLMFCIPLVTALYTEMYLRPQGAHGIGRWCVLSCVIVTTQSTLGMMLMVLAWVIKVFEHFHRSVKVLIPLLLGVCVCFSFFILRKTAFELDSEFASTAYHLQDYIICAKAFLKHPLTGGGYENYDYLRLFMSPERLERNRGLSNSIAAVFGMGGLMLGGFCLLPFILCLLTAVKNKNWNAAYWGLGALGIYTVIIYPFHMFLLLQIASGYSLVRIKKNKSGGKRTLSLYRPGPEALQDGCHRRDIWIIAVLGLLLLLSPGKAWDGAYRFLLEHQLFIGQSVWMPTGFAAAVIWGCVSLDSALKSSGKKRVLKLGVLGACSLICWAGLPSFYAAVNTFLYGKTAYWQPAQACILAAGYFALTEAGMLLTDLAFPMRADLRKAFISLVLFLVPAGLCFAMHSEALKRENTAPDDEKEVLDVLLGSGNGWVTADDMPLLYHETDPRIRLSMAKGFGHALQKNVSVIIDINEDIPELFDAGFQAAAISSQHLLYSNDDKAVSALEEKGFAFKRYYPEAFDYSLRSIARRNGLQYSKKAGILIKGSGAAIVNGPYDTLKRGDYILSVYLRSDRNKKDSGTAEDERTLFGKLSVSINYGEKVIAEKDVFTDEFDENGELNARLSFRIDQIEEEGVEFFLQPEDRQSAQVLRVRAERYPTYTTVTEYDGFHQVVRQHYYSADGTSYRMPQGYSELKQKTDRFGNITSVRYYNENGDPMRISAGYFGYDRTYNSRKQLLSDIYFDVDDRPIRLSGGYSGILYEYNSIGKVSSLTYIDSDYRPVLLNEGYACTKREYNAEGRVILEQFFDENGGPAVLDKGYSAISYERDRYGNASSMCYLNADLQPVMIRAGYAEVRREYDAKGQVISEEYYDDRGNLLLMSGGYYILRKDYDDFGNVVKLQYCDEHGELTKTNYGYSELRRTYNAQKQLIYEAFYSETEEPVVRPDGFSAVRYTRDEVGNVIEKTYLDGNDDPVMLVQGYSTIRSQYDRYNQCVREDHYDTEDQLVLGTEGYASVEYEWDQNGNAVILRYYGTGGEKVYKSGGFSELHRDFNSAGQIIAYSYYDVNGELMELPEGNAFTEFERDNQGRAIEERYYNIDHEPVNISWGYARMQKKLDQAGNTQDIVYYDSEGNQVEKP